MKIDYDPAKNEANAEKHGVSLTEAHAFDWGGAVYFHDGRKDYGEKRFVAIGLHKQRLHAACFVHITGGVRIISFRIAHKKEIKYYEENWQ